MSKSRLSCALYATVFVLITTGANAAVLPLESRLGGLAVYDPNLDITWLTDANLRATQGLADVRLIQEIGSNWAANLVVGGLSGWRLPSADVNNDGVVIDCSGGGVLGCSDNEFGFLYWEEGITADELDPFVNLATPRYWTSTTDMSINRLGYAFNFAQGRTELGVPDSLLFVWAVRDGDVAVIPIPAAVWLFSTALIGLFRFCKGRKTA